MSEIQMKITQCTKCSRYYNSANTPTCPWCSGGVTAPPEQGGFSETQDVYGNNSAGMGAPVAPGQGGSGVTVGVNYNGNMSKTLDPYNENIKEEMGVTITIPPDDEIDVETHRNTPLVVGWLVVLSGEKRGMDYKLHSGYNSIGREEGDICIPGDGTISRKNDCTIAYDIRSKSFYFANKEGHNPPAVNGVSVIDRAIQIKAYDIITVGRTDLLFVPLCGEHFQWGEGVING